MNSEAEHVTQWSGSGMVQSVVERGFFLLCAYAAAGAVMSAALHVRGLSRIDHATAGSKLLFRVLITPGLIAFWPLMAIKWRKAARGEDTSGPYDRPISAGGLRAIHRHLIRLIGVLTPIAVAAAVATRPPAIVFETSLNAFATPATAGEVIAQRSGFWGLPVTCRVRAASKGNHQLELEGSEQLPHPSLAVYLVPAGAEETPGEGVFLGAFWGPGVRRYEISAEAVRPGTKLLLYSLADGITAGVDSLPAANE